MRISGPIDADSSTLPQHLAALRERQGWTLAELAARTGLSRPYLSRLESGARQPSLGALLTLAKAYETPIATLLDGIAPSATGQTVTRSDRAQVQRSNGLRYRTISAAGANTSLSGLRVTVPRRRRQTIPSEHEGEELLYVLSGELRLTLGAERHTLTPGDSAHFDARIPHHVSAAGSEDVELLLVASPARVTSGVAQGRVAAGASGTSRPKTAIVHDRTAVVCPALQ